MSVALREWIADLSAAFSYATIEPRTMRVYERELADLDVADVCAAIREMIRVSDRFPTVHAIRDAVAELQLGLPTESEALEQATTPCDVHPLVRASLHAVGGRRAFAVAEQPGVVRGQFLADYRDRRRRAIRVVVTGSSKPAIGRASAATAIVLPT